MLSQGELQKKRRGNRRWWWWWSSKRLRLLATWATVLVSFFLSCLFFSSRFHFPLVLCSLSNLLGSSCSDLRIWSSWEFHHTISNPREKKWKCLLPPFCYFFSFLPFIVSCFLQHVAYFFFSLSLFFRPPLLSIGLYYFCYIFLEKVSYNHLSSVASFRYTKGHWDPLHTSLNVYLFTWFIFFLIQLTLMIHVHRINIITSGDQIFLFFLFPLPLSFETHSTLPCYLFFFSFLRSLAKSHEFLNVH